MTLLLCVLAATLDLSIQARVNGKAVNPKDAALVIGNLDILDLAIQVRAATIEENLDLSLASVQLEVTQRGQPVPVRIAEIGKSKSLTLHTLWLHLDVGDDAWRAASMREGWKKENARRIARGEAALSETQIAGMIEYSKPALGNHRLGDYQVVARHADRVAKLRLAVEERRDFVAALVGRMERNH